MALKISVKVDSVNNLSTARYVSGMAVDYLGIQWQGESDEEIGALKKLYADLSGWLSGINWVLECESLSASVLAFARAHEISFVEVQNPLDESKPEGIQIFGRVQAVESIEAMLQTSDVLIISHDTFFGLGPEVLLKSTIPILVSEISAIDQLEELQKLESSYGIAIGSNSEGKTGFLQDDFLMDVLEELDDY